MKTFTVEVKNDHLRTISRTKKPIIALAELIWNGLDAEAERVEVVLEENGLGELQAIRVRDDGHGISYGDAEVCFSSLGGSWKRSDNKSKSGIRMLHGRLGKGRFRALSLGGRVQWQTSYSDNGDGVKQYTISKTRADPRQFTMTDPVEADLQSGTEVIVDEMEKNFRSLRGENAIHEITAHFALYLRQYPDVSIVYEGRPIDPVSIESAVENIDLEIIKLEDGREFPASLTIIEWSHAAETKRRLFLCDESGFALTEMKAGIHAKGYEFTAYLKSGYIRELDAEGLLIMEELHPVLESLVETARQELRNYFRRRSAQDAEALVAEWKKEEVYPYEGEPENPVQKAEREVFDVCALNIHSYLPDFESTSSNQKHLTFKLLRNALQTGPAALQRILREVLGLPESRQEDFANLLEKTSLDAIISASATVTGRLDFLKGIELMVFDKDSKKEILERCQLHRILAEHTWLFGECYNLTLDDQSLTELLKKHRAKLGDKKDIVDEVRREDGRKGIVDLVLGRRIPTAHAEEREHLVVELKRPKHRINDKDVSQIKSYAQAVARDERFRDTGTKWVFWLVSNEMTNGVEMDIHQQDRPQGLLVAYQKENITIWVKTWSQVLAECEGRLEFFQNELNYRADRQSALQYLKKDFKQFMPEALQDGDAAADEKGSNER